MGHHTARLNLRIPQKVAEALAERVALMQAQAEARRPGVRVSVSGYVRWLIERELRRGEAAGERTVGG